jgi:hypothetical protein
MRYSKSRVTLAPTDLSNFLSFRHLTGLDLSALKNGDKRPARYGPVIDALRERGIAHEKAYLETLRQEGLSICEGGEEERQPKAFLREPRCLGLRRAALIRRRDGCP